MRPPAPLFHAAHAAIPDLSGEWLALRGGRTNVVWQVGEYVIKSYRLDRTTPLFPNNPLDEIRALQGLENHGLAPVLVAYGADWLAYRYLDGTCWTADSSIVARLFGRLHSLPPETVQLKPKLGGSGPLAAETGKMLEQAGLAVALPPVSEVGSYAPVLIHGDAVPGNIIVLADHAVLIDWQCPALGDAAEDISTFLSPAMQLIYRGKPLDEPEIAAFRGAYPHKQALQRYDALRPLFHLRMAAHCRIRAMAKDAGYGEAAELELRAAASCLAAGA